MRITIPQRLIAYPREEWDGWRCGPYADPEAIRTRQRTVWSIIRETGPMGRTIVPMPEQPTGVLNDQVADVYMNQCLYSNNRTSQNYSEAKTAQIALVRELACAPDDIYYENYYLSADEYQKAAGGMSKAGTERLQSLFRPEFFELYDELYDRNYGVGPMFTARKPRTTKTSVPDLFGYSRAHRVAAFLESKTYHPKATKHEAIEPHQHLFMAILGYLFGHHPHSLIVEEAGLTSVRVEFVVLYCDEDDPPDASPQPYELDVLI